MPGSGDHDAVGYGRPPKASQFKKGMSGNPKGRPKGARSLASIVAHATEERVTVTEGGRRRSLTKLDIAIKQLVNKAAGGDIKSLRELLRLLEATQLHARPTEETSAPLTESDRKVLQALRERIARIAAANDGEKK